MDERRIIGWRVQGSSKSWIFFADRQRAESFANERKAAMQECYSDGTVQTIYRGDERGGLTPAQRGSRSFKVGPRVLSANLRIE
jgi:hypothetical protein